MSSQHQGMSLHDNTIILLELLEFPQVLYIVMFKSKICNQSYCVKQLKKVSCQCLNWSCLYWLLISAVISLLYEKGMRLVAHILKKKTPVEK